MTNPMETAFDALDAAVSGRKSTEVKTQRMDLLFAMKQWADQVPVALLPDMTKRFADAVNASELTVDPLAGTAMLFNGQATPVANGSVPLALGGSTAAPAAPEPAPSLSPEQLSLLDAAQDLPSSRLRWWEDQIRHAKGVLAGDREMGFTNAVEDLLEGKLEVDKLGRPLAEQTIHELTRDNTRLENDKSRLSEQVKMLSGDKTSLTSQMETLRTDLAAARTAKPTGTTPASDELLVATLTTIGFVNGLYGLRAPSTLSATDEQAVIDYLMKGSFQTAVGNAAKAEGDKRNDAEAKVKTYVEAAKTARIKLRSDVFIQTTGTGRKAQHQIVGRKVVDQELREITGDMPELATS